MTEKLRVGVIGGMGPLATIDFMTLVLKLTPASCDQDHIQLIVDQNPTIPSRQQAIRNGGENPGPAIAASASRLEQSGADFLVMPCNLAHAWEADIKTSVTVPFVSIVTETVAAALARSDEGSPVGLLTTPGCFAAGLYQDALAESSRPQILQTAEEQASAMDWVDRIKRGDQSAEVRDGLRALAQALVDRGARVLIAACTEFPLLLDESMFDVAFISSTEALAKATVARAVAG